MNFEAPRSSSSGPRRRTPHHRAQARVLTAGTCIECLLLPRRALPPRRRTAGDRRRSLAGLPRAGTVPPGAAEVPANAQPERRTLIARSQVVKAISKCSVPPCKVPPRGYPPKVGPSRSYPATPPSSDLWYYRFFVKSADLSRFRPFSDFRGRSVPKHGGPNQNGGRLGRHPPVWGDAKLWWVWKIRGRRGKGVDAPCVKLR